MNEIKNSYPNNEVVVQDMTIENRLEIIEEGIRKNYLARLTEMAIAPIQNLMPLEEDLIDNVRLYKVTEMVYQKGESAIEKFTTVFNTLSTYKATAFIILDSDGKRTDFYVGVRNNEVDETLKRSTVTLGDTLKHTLVGQFPGIKIKNENRFQIAELSQKILRQQNVTSVSVVGDSKSNKEQSNEQFVQGLEKLALAMQGRQYVGVIIAENRSSHDIQNLRKGYQNTYTQLSSLQKVQFSVNDTTSSSRSKSFSEMDGKQKAAMIGGAAVSLLGAVGGAALGAGIPAVGMGAMVGGQIAGHLSGFINSLAPNEQLSTSKSTSMSSTTENKAVTDLLQLLDEFLCLGGLYESKKKGDMPMEKCKVIALTNQKGGVAKTTSTVNLGVGLANQGYRVLLIDADPQGSLTISLGVKNPDELDVSLATVMDAVIDDEMIAEDAGILHHEEGVDLLPANIELSGMETGLFNIMSREYVLKNYIDKMRHNYDYVLIDCMPSLGMMTINALVAADSVIIPSQPSFLSTKGLNLLLHSISKVRRSINPKLTIDGILLTMVDNRTINAKDIISSLRNGVGQNIKVFATEIPHSVRAAECSLTGKSIFSHDKSGKVATAYENLVKEVEQLEKTKDRFRSDRVR